LPPCTSTSTSCTHFPPSFDIPFFRESGTTWPSACTATPLGTSCTRLTTWFSRTLAGGAGGPPSAGRPSASAFTTWRHDDEGSTETESEEMHLWFGGRCQWPAVRGAALRQRLDHLCTVNKHVSQHCEGFVTMADGQRGRPAICKRTLLHCLSHAKGSSFMIHAMEYGSSKR